MEQNKTLKKDKTIVINGVKFYISAEGKLVDLENALAFSKRRLSSSSLNGENNIREFVKENYYKLGIKSPNWNVQLKMDALDCIISNVMEGLKRKKVIKISFDKRSFTRMRSKDFPFYTHQYIVNAVYILVERGYLLMKKGYQDKKSGKSRQTRIWASEKLVKELKAISSSTATCIEFVKYVQTVGNTMPYLSSVATIKKPYSFNPLILRKTIRKDSNGNKIHKQVKYSETQKTYSMRNMLLEYNTLMANNIVLIPNDEYLKHHYKESTIKVAYNSVDRITDNLYIIDNIHYGGILVTQDASMDIGEVDKEKEYKYINGRENSIEGGAAITKSNSLYVVDFTRVSPYVHRVFSNNSFNEGGRFYGADYQLYDSETRSKLLINGNQVIELDYRSLHANMMYNLEGKKLLHDPYNLYNDNQILRKAVKYMFNIAINSNDIANAIAAFSWKINTKPKLRAIKEEMHKLNLTSENILDKILESHPLFNNYLGSGIGLKFQNWDSNIAEMILKHFTQKEIPCLCVHDSFLVERHYEEELRETMDKAYKAFFKGFDCKINKK